MKRLFPYVIALVAFIGIGIIAYPFIILEHDKYRYCQRLKDIVQDENKRAYLVEWAERFANDQQYLQSFSDIGSIVIDRTKYRQFYAMPFDWAKLDDRLLGIEIMFRTRKILLDDDTSKIVVSFVTFPDRRNAMNVIVDPEFDFEAYAQGDSSGHLRKIDEKVFLYCE